jgi:gas vesicle protein
MNERMPYLTAIVGFLAGGIAGATAALLLAPQSGRDTRQAMARKVNDTADAARGMKDRVLNKGDDMWNEAVHRVSGAVSALSGDGHTASGEPL